MSAETPSLAELFSQEGCRCGHLLVDHRIGSERNAADPCRECNCPRYVHAPGVVGDAGTPEPASLAMQAAIAAGNARVRHNRYTEDCNPVDELDEHGRTFDRAVADVVLAVPGVAAALRIAAAVEAEPKTCLVDSSGRKLWNAHNVLLDRLRAVGKDTDQP